MITEKDITLEDFTHLSHYYFRIDAGYVWGKGMSSQKASIAFFDEAEKVIREAGFDLVVRGSANSISACPKGYTTEGDNYVYCHPMEFSGYMTKDMAANLLNAIKKFEGSIFTLRTIDVYDLRQNDLNSLCHNMRGKEKAILKLEE